MTDNSSKSSPDSPADHPGIRSLNKTYWLCNVIEMWERLAYYTLRPIAPIYIASATNAGGLHLTQGHKAAIYSWWAIVQSILPMITGGFADRYGYKKSLFISITLNVTGYLIMAYMRTYEGFFLGILVLALGTSLFKPSLQATLAHNLPDGMSSIGWGIFYWIVNVGSTLGHYISPLILGTSQSVDNWRHLFLWCAVFSALNYVMLFTYKEVPSGASKTENPFKVFWRIIINVFERRLVAWLLIMSCFWLMMYQLWDLQPNFIEDWVDSSMVAAHVPFDKWKETSDQGLLRVPQQVLISFNSVLIVMFMIPVSWAVRKMRTLSAMFFGMLMATGGVLVAGMTGSAVFLLLGILLFSLGEMLTGPKKNEYLGLIAPPGKKGLYLGYVNIPIGIGVGIGSYLGGFLYGNYGEKANLALKHLLNCTPFGEGKSWDGSLDTLEASVGVSRTDAFLRLQEVLGLDAVQTTQLLWDTYNPQYYVWLPFAAIGVIAAIALAIFGQLAKRWSDMNA